MAAAAAAATPKRLGPNDWNDVRSGEMKNSFATRSEGTDDPADATYKLLDLFGGGPDETDGRKITSRIRTDKRRDPIHETRVKNQPRRRKSCAVSIRVSRERGYTLPDDDDLYIHSSGLRNWPSVGDNAFETREPDDFNR